MTHYVPIVLDVVVPLTEPRLRRILVVGEMFMDQQKYFHFIMFNIMVSTFLGMTAVVAAETMLMTLIQHVCGLLKVTRYYSATYITWMYLPVSVFVSILYVTFWNTRPSSLQLSNNAYFLPRFPLPGSKFRQKVHSLCQVCERRNDSQECYHVGIYFIFQHSILFAHFLSFIATFEKLRDRIFIQFWFAKGSPTTWEIVLQHPILYWSRSASLP